MNRFARLLPLLAALATPALFSHAWAQDNYPNRTVRIITTNSAGGISDVFRARSARSCTRCGARRSSSTTGLAA